MRGKLKIEISRDSMSASACVMPEGNMEITVPLIREELEKHGIKAGIDERAVQELGNHGILKKVYVLAKGVPAKRGRDGYYEFLFDKDAKENVPRIRKDGSVDYSPNITIVEKGDKVAIYHPPVEGSLGYTIFDSVVAPTPSKDAERISLVKVEQRENEFFAMTSGRVSFKMKKLEVTDCFVLNGDAGYATGMLNFNGDVRVLGDIKDGVVMNIDGSLEVTGEIDAAQIKVGKNLIVHGGIHGKQKAEIEVGGTVTANFIEGAKVNAKGDVVAGHVINAKIISRNNVSVEGENGSIIGGEIEADECISAVRIGNETGVRTELKIRSSDIWSREYARIVVEDRMFPETNVQINGIRMRDCQLENGELHLTGKVLKAFEIGTYQYDDIEEKLKEAEELEKAEQQKQKEKPMILVVDDDPVFLKTQYTYLAEEYLVAVVNSATDALAFIKKKCPDLILLDYMMPKMNGGELLEKIRALSPEEGKDVPVFFLTSVTDKRVIVQCLSLYPQGYLIKPLSKEELLKIIGDFFAKVQGETA